MPFVAMFLGVITLWSGSAFGEEPPALPAAAASLAATATELESGAAFLDAVQSQGATCEGSVSWQGSSIRTVAGVERYSRAWKSGQPAYDRDWQWAYHLLNDGPWEMKRLCPADLPNTGVAGWGGYGFNCPRGTLDVTRSSLRSEAAAYRKLADVVSCIEARLPDVKAALKQEEARAAAPPPPAAPAAPAPVAPVTPPPPTLEDQLARDRAYAEAQGAAWTAVGQVWADAAPQLAQMASDTPDLYGRAKVQLDISFPMIGATLRGTTRLAFPMSLTGRYFAWFNHPDRESRSNGLEVFLEPRGTLLVPSDVEPYLALGTRVYYRGLGVGPILVGSLRMNGPAPGVTVYLGTSPAPRAFMAAIEGIVATDFRDPFLGAGVRIGANIFNVRFGYEVARGNDLFSMQLGTRLSSKERRRERAPKVKVPAALAALEGQPATLRGTLRRTNHTPIRGAEPDWPDIPRSLRGEVWVIDQDGRYNACVLVPDRVLAGQPVRSASTPVAVTGTLVSTKSRMCPLLLVAERVD